MIGGLLTLARGVVGFIFLLFGMGVLAFFLHGLTLPLMLVWPWAYRRLTEMFLSCGLTCLVAMNEKLHNIKVKARGDSIERHEKTVVIMNHRTRLDWMYFFHYLYHMRVLNRQKITLKAAIKWFPIIGWSLQTAGYIFLNRKADEDEAYIRRSLRYFEELGCKPNILIFPEGTDLSPNNVKRSHEYSESRGLAHYQYVLHPRVKGFVWYVQTLRQVGGIQAVHDITIGYPDQIICNEKAVLLGKLPKEVHYEIQRYSIDELPLDDEGLANWIKARWLEKEERLKNFYSKESAKRVFDAGDYTQPNQFRANCLWIVLLLWTAAGCLLAYLFVTSCVFVIYCFALSAFFIFVTYKFGGMGTLEMDVYDRFYKPVSRWAVKKKD